MEQNTLCETQDALLLAQREDARKRKQDDRRFPQPWHAMVAVLCMVLLLLPTIYIYTVLTMGNPSQFGSTMIDYICSQLVMVLPAPFLLMAIFRQDIPATCRMKKKLSVVQVLLLIAVAVGGFFVCQFINGLFVLLLKAIGLPLDINQMDVETTKYSQTLLEIVIVVGLPAFCEEFFYRGLVMRSFERYSTAVAIVLSSLTFGIMHANFLQLVYATLVGFILALVTMNADCLWAGAVVHGTMNLMTVLFSSFPVSKYYESFMKNNAVASSVLGISFLLLALGLVGFMMYTHNRNKRLYGVAVPNEIRYPLKKPSTRGTMLFLALWVIFAVLNTVLMLSKLNLS